LETDGEGVQTATTFIEQMGSSTETITEETFKDGANTIYVSLYRIYQQGITISSITPLKNTVGIPTSRSFSMGDLIDIIHPVGKIFFTDDPRNPSEYYPGTTWVAWGSGRVPVGVDVNDSDFNAPNKTVGAKSHSYTPAGTVNGHVLTVNEIPSHRHDVNYQHMKKTGGMSPFIVAQFDSGNSNVGLDDAVTSSDLTGNNAAHTHPFTGTASTQSHIQPSITCYMWKRTA
jgi:hypothetical protein